MGAPFSSNPVSYTHLDVYKRQDHNGEHYLAVVPYVEDPEKMLEEDAHDNEPVSYTHLASLATDSFLSAASFQETTRVLTDAAIKGKVCLLYTSRCV